MGYGYIHVTPQAPATFYPAIKQKQHPCTSYRPCHSHCMYANEQYMEGIPYKIISYFFLYIASSSDKKILADTHRLAGHVSRSDLMNISISLIPIVSLFAGILIFIMPRLLSTIVATYLIVVGLSGLFGHFLK